MTPGAVDDDDYYAAFATVHGPGPTYEAVGGGLLVWEDGTLITAAHVVNSALGRDPDAGSPGQATVMVGFPGGDAAPVPATVMVWVPRKDPGNAGPLRAGAETWAGDLAVLRLQAPLPEGARSARMADHRLESTVYCWYGSGESTTPVRAKVISDAGPWIVLETTGSAKKFFPGYSGGPLWDRQRRSVVGLMVSVDGDRGYAMPLREISKHLAGHVPMLCPAETPFNQSALETLHTLLIKVLVRLGPRVDMAKRVARQVGCYESLEGADATAVYRLLACALAVHRGIATVAGGFCRLTDDPLLRRQLTAAALRVRPGQMLGADEYGKLSRMLAWFSVADLHRAARRALPDSHDFGGDARDVLRLQDALEHLSWTSESVPALLLAVEFIAAGAPVDDQQALRGWAEQVMDRIGVDPVRLDDRRVEAERWAARTERDVRVQIHLDRVDEGTFRHSVWVGIGVDRVTMCTEDHPMPREGILRCLAGVLTRVVPPDASSVLLEFFVGEQDIDLDVERWSLPGAVARWLGVEYEVVVRCLGPRLLSKAQWYRRWQRLGLDPPAELPAKLKTSDDAYKWLKGSDTACVAAFPDDERRKALILGCVYAGVPAVLWSRRPNPDRSQLLRLCNRDSQAALPYHVRKYRESAVMDAEHPGGHLALVFDDPQNYPEALTEHWILAVPQEEE